jgi:hypothetical protein
MITQQQYGRLLREYARTQNMSNSAMKAGVDRKTARKYIEAKQPPEQLQGPRTWRTREDPLAEVWPKAEKMLLEAPELEGKGLFEFFLEQADSGLEPKHLRTFQRRVCLWRAVNGPEKEVFFPQRQTPGESMQLDWTHAKELGVTIGGEGLDHLLCHCVLPYSNWQWATRCQSESFLSLVRGLQESLGQLGRKPRYLGTDNSSAATHEIGCGSGERAFNPDYLDLCEHYGLLPVTINVACPHEHGDVESQNGHLKRRIKQHLLLRGSRDFESEEKYDEFLAGVMEAANRPREDRLAEELARMAALPPTRLAEYQEVRAWVGQHSTIRVKKVTYSVPSRLVGQYLRVEVHESVLRLYLDRQCVLELPRSRGRGREAVINFRDVVGPLLRKPGAFMNYQHREQLYPTVVYRTAFDRLVLDHGQRPGVIEYLHLLKLAGEQTVSKVEAALAAKLASPKKWWAAEVRAALVPTAVAVPSVSGLVPELHCYDELLESSEEVAHVG